MRYEVVLRSQLGRFFFFDLHGEVRNHSCMMEKRNHGRVRTSHDFYFLPIARMDGKIPFWRESIEKSCQGTMCQVGPVDTIRTLSSTSWPPVGQHALCAIFEHGTCPGDFQSWFFFKDIHSQQRHAMQEKYNRQLMCQPY
jgi:hypothetical protein